ncbi:MAG: outer membrane protein assembly factor BamA [Deltaproteobacteria bacterium]|nr:outer membrane protein assembly factor BamA [Deltaproteobacteria bacterium]
MSSPGQCLIIIFSFLFIIAAPNNYLLAAKKQNDNVITAIALEGNRRVEKEAAFGDLKSKVGSVLNDDLLTEDLHTIWRTGFFRDVSIEKQRYKNGWRILFIVSERPSIRKIQYVGRNSISEEDIQGVVDVKPYTILNIELLKKNVEKIKELYVQKGFYLAKISYHTEAVENSSDEVDVYFDLVENSRVSVREISFFGNKHLSSEFLKSGIQTQEGSEVPILSQSGTYTEEYFQNDLMRIQSAYYDKGYIKVKIADPTITMSLDRRFIYLSVGITEGKQYKVDKISFSGDIDLKDKQGNIVIDTEHLRNNVSLESNEIFSSTKLHNDMNNLADLYRDRGYAFANVTPNSAIHDDNLTVDLDFEVQRGDLVHFERIEIVGNTRTRDRVIRRELKIYESERYSSTALNQSRANIFALGYFETVNISTTRGSRPDLMNVRIEIKEKATGSFQMGAGFSSVENFMLQLQVSQNNFLGYGWSMALSAQLTLSSGPYSHKLVSAQFYNPYFMDTKWALGADGYLTQRFYPEFERRSTGLSPHLGYPITEKIRLVAGYTIEKVEVDSSSDQLMYGLAVKGINSAIKGSISYDTRNNRLSPTLGQFHSITGEISHPSLGSSTELSFMRYGITMRYYHPLIYSFVLKLNAEFGYVTGVEGRGAPLGERFFPGGIFSVRGYEPRGLGASVPTVSKNNPSSTTSAFTIGGNKQAIFNVEVEVPLIEAANIKGVVFFDAGNAFNDDQNFFYINTNKDLIPNVYLMRSNREISPPLGLFYSFGFGIRWFSPIGPLRFEWGIPITKPSPTSRSSIFEFMIGSFF